MIQTLTSVFVTTDWLQETLPQNCFNKNGTKLIIPLEFSMNSILEGRKNYESYSFFFNRFVSLLEKKSQFKNRMITAQSDEDPYFYKQ